MRIRAAAPSVLKRCQEGVQRTYSSIDRMIGQIQKLADKDTAIFVVSDYGGTSQQFKAVDVAKVLEETGFLKYKGRGKNREVDFSRTKAMDVGLIHIFVNPKRCAGT